MKKIVWMSLSLMWSRGKQCKILKIWGIIFPHKTNTKANIRVDWMERYPPRTLDPNILVPKMKWSTARSTTRTIIRSAVGSGTLRPMWGRNLMTCSEGRIHDYIHFITLSYSTTIFFLLLFFVFQLDFPLFVRLIFFFFHHNTLTSQIFHIFGVFTGWIFLQW